MSYGNIILPKKYASLVVAASDSKTPRLADILCTGTADQNVINNALESGIEIKLLDGTYNITRTILPLATSSFIGCGVGTKIQTPTNVMLDECEYAGDAQVAAVWSGTGVTMGQSVAAAIGASSVKATVDVTGNRRCGRTIASQDLSLLKEINLFCQCAADQTNIQFYLSDGTNESYWAVTPGAAWDKYSGVGRNLLDLSTPASNNGSNANLAAITGFGFLGLLASQIYVFDYIRATWSWPIIKLDTITGCTIRDLYLYGSRIDANEWFGRNSYGNGDGLYIANGGEHFIQRIWAENMLDSGICVYASDENILTVIRAKSCALDGTESYQGERNNWSNIIAKACAGQAGIYAHETVDEIYTNLIAEANVNSDVTDGMHLSGPKRCTVNGGTFNNNGFHGLHDNSSAAAWSKNRIFNVGGTGNGVDGFNITGVNGIACNIDFRANTRYGLAIENPGGGYQVDGGQLTGNTTADIFIAVDTVTANHLNNLDTWGGTITDNAGGGVATVKVNVT